MVLEEVNKQPFLFLDLRIQIIVLLHKRIFNCKTDLVNISGPQFLRLLQSPLYLKILLLLLHALK